MIKQLSMIGAAIAMTAGTLIPAAPAAAQRYYGDRYDNGGNGYYRGDRGYRNDRGYYRGNRYQDRRGYRGYRCRDSGTGGTIIGAIAGGLLGHEVVGRRGDKTAGTIVGAGVGALAGRAIDRNDGRRC